MTGLSTENTIFLGCERNIQSNHKGDYDYYEDLVDEVFRRQLMKCEEEEMKYFHEHNEIFP